MPKTRLAIMMIVEILLIAMNKGKLFESIPQQIDFLIAVVFTNLETIKLIDRDQ